MKNDWDLVNAYLSGEENCLSELWEKHKDSLFYTILQNNNYDDYSSDDILQDCFISIKEAFDSGKCKNGESIKNWMQTICRNKTMDSHRSKSRKRQIKIVEPDFIDLHVRGLDFEEEEEIEPIKYKEILLREAPKVLSELQLGVMRSRIIEEMSFKEIAEERNISINTMLGVMRYARNKMKAHFEKHTKLLE